MHDLSLPKQELWESRISEYRSSGQTARSWCEHNNVSVSALKYWITKLNRKRSYQDISSEPVFARVLLSEEITSAPIRIHMENFQIEVNNNCSPVLLSSLMSVLKIHA